MVVHGAMAQVGGGVDEAQLRRTVDVLLRELPPGRAAAVAAQLTGAPRASAYALALQRGTAPAEPGAASQGPKRRQRRFRLTYAGTPVPSARGSRPGNRCSA